MNTNEHEQSSQRVIFHSAVSSPQCPSSAPFATPNRQFGVNVTNLGAFNNSSAKPPSRCSSVASRSSREGSQRRERDATPDTRRSKTSRHEEGHQRNAPKHATDIVMSQSLSTSAAADTIEEVEISVDPTIRPRVSDAQTQSAKASPHSLSSGIAITALWETRQGMLQEMERQSFVKKLFADSKLLDEPPVADEQCMTFEEIDSLLLHL